MTVKNIQLNNTVTYQKSINATTANLADVRKFVFKYAQKHGFSAKQIDDIQLAVDEACTNIIKHAYNYDESKKLTIDLEFESDQLIVILTDQGAGFNTDKYKKPDLKKQIEKKKRGGMGVYLIKNLMDDVTYYAKNQKNILRMSKNRS